MRGPHSVHRHIQRQADHDVCHDVQLQTASCLAHGECWKLEAWSWKHGIVGARGKPAVCLESKLPGGCCLEGKLPVLPAAHTCTGRILVNRLPGKYSGMQHAGSMS